MFEIVNGLGAFVEFFFLNHEFFLGKLKPEKEVST